MFKWTFELHSQFMDAVNERGGITSAVSSDIVVLMNVPGLTREKVQSHFQKIQKLHGKGPGRMNKNAIFHQEYLLTTPGGARIIQDWSRFLSACDNLCGSSSRNNDNNNNNVSHGREQYLPGPSSFEDENDIYGNLSPFCDLLTLDDN